MGGLKSSSPSNVVHNTQDESSTRRSCKVPYPRGSVSFRFDRLLHLHSSNFSWTLIRPPRSVKQSPPFSPRAASSHAHHPSPVLFPFFTLPPRPSWTFSLLQSLNPFRSSAFQSHTLSPCGLPFPLPKPSPHMFHFILSGSTPRLYDTFLFTSSTVPSAFCLA